MKILAAFFDCDGTLNRIEEDHVEAWQATLASFGYNGLSLDVYRPLAGKSGKLIAERLREHCGIREDVAEIYQRRQRFLGIVQARNGVRLMEDNVALLKEMACLQPDLLFAVVSSSPLHRVTPTVEKAGLENVVAYISTPDRVAGMKQKPEPDVYLHAMRVFGVLPERCLAFENSEPGVVAAKAAAIPCVAVPDEISRFQDFSRADLVIYPGETRTATEILARFERRSNLPTETS